MPFCGEGGLGWGCLLSIGHPVGLGLVRPGVGQLTDHLIPFGYLVLGWLGNTWRMPCYVTVCFVHDACLLGRAVGIMHEA